MSLTKTNGGSSFFFSSPSQGLIAQYGNSGVTLTQTFYSDPLGTLGSTIDFAVRLTNSTGFPPANCWKGLVVVDDTGATRTYLASAGTYTHPSGTDSIWTFGTGSSPVWTATTARLVGIY